jgi:hypothetical protein
LRTQLLARLAIRLAELAHPRRAMSVALEVEDEVARPAVLGEVALHLEEPSRGLIFQEALVITGKIWSETARSRALGKLAPYLPEPQLIHALAMARRMQDNEDRIRALGGLVPYLPEPLNHEVLEEAWTTSPGRTLHYMTLHLPDAYIEEAVQMVRTIWDQSRRLEVLPSLVTRLAAMGFQSVALELAQEIGDAGTQANALRGMAAYLSEPYLREALEMARGIRGRDIRMPALMALIHRLSDLGYAEEALRAVREIEDEAARTLQLASLIPYLPESLKLDTLREALAMARDLADDPSRVRVLDRLAPHLAQLPEDELYPLWAETLPVLASRPRPKLFGSLRAMAPVMNALGGEEAVAETFRAIQEVGRWWP